MSTYCPYCLHRMDEDELTETGLRQELAHRLYPDVPEFGNDTPWKRGWTDEEFPR